MKSSLVSNSCSCIVKCSASILALVFLFACKDSTMKASKVELIINKEQQEATFKSLLSLTNNSIPESLWNDSLSFLVLPIQASCPSCRDKTIDSIDKNQSNLNDRQFIIISCNGGRKTISSFFRKRNKVLPVIERNLFLDSTKAASEYKLYDSQPTMYYAAGGKVFKKVVSKPSSIKEDLHYFFQSKSLFKGQLIN